MKLFSCKFFTLLWLLFLSVISFTFENLIDNLDEIVPTRDFKPRIKRKCNHQRTDLKKYYLSTNQDRKESSSYYSDIQFEKMRIHFDYTFTLPYEEKVISELIIPPVKKFFENTLSVRKFPGKLRFPKNVESCQDVPIPQHLRDEGVDSDLLIIVSTYRGMKKYNYENNLKKDSLDLNQKKKNNTKNKMHGRIEESSSNTNIYEYLNRYFSTKFDKKNFKAKDDTYKIPPWEINDADPEIVGWSFMCLQDIFTLRPVAGIMQYVADINPTPRAIEEAIWTTLHEITHVLAMDFDLYADFIDKDFNKLTYENTIKIKSKLVGLDKFLQERKHVLDDIEAFINFKPKDDLKSEEDNVKGTNNTKVFKKEENKYIKHIKTVPQTNKKKFYGNKSTAANHNNYTDNTNKTFDLNQNNTNNSSTNNSCYENYNNTDNDEVKEKEPSNFKFELPIGEEYNNIPVYKI